jgi:hypothetical protein
MTEYLKPIIIAPIILAFLILPSSASVGIMGENSSVLDNNPPLAYDLNVVMTENIPAEITLHATDPDGDTMTYSIGTGPLNGTLGPVTGNTIVYTPDTNFTGGDSFRFRSHDGTWDSNLATVTITVRPDCSLNRSQSFFGRVTIDGKPAPADTMLSVEGEGVRSNTTGNPAATRADGSYGSINDSAQSLQVQGCLEDGALLTFYADGVQAEVSEANTSGSWQSTWPFRAGEVTNLNLRVTTPVLEPDTVSIHAIGVTISNSTYGYSQSVIVEKNPWVELRVSPGMTIQISVTGFHDFTDNPILGRNATLGIYEHGNPVSPKVNVAFGSRTASYDYIANETRTFDLLISVNERPEICAAKQMTIYVLSGPGSSNTTTPGGSGESTSPAGWVSGDAGAGPSGE